MNKCRENRALVGSLVFGSHHAKAEDGFLDQIQKQLDLSLRGKTFFGQTATIETSRVAYLRARNHWLSNLSQAGQKLSLVLQLLVQKLSRIFTVEPESLRVWGSWLKWCPQQFNNAVPTAFRGKQPSEPQAEPAQVWGYARVCRVAQAESADALEQQLAQLEAAGVPRDRILYDVAAGTASDRAQFKQLLSLLEQGKVQVLVVTRWDRLLRSATTYEPFKALVQRHGVKLRLLDQDAVVCSEQPQDLISRALSRLGRYNHERS